MDDIYPDWPGQDLSKIAGLSFLKNQQLADLGFGEKGKIDILLGLSDVTSCYFSSPICAPEFFVEARESNFGWVVHGAQPEMTSSNVVLKISLNDARADELIQRLRKQEDVLDQVFPYTENEVYALYHFKDNTMREPDGRYSVSLPIRIPTPRLGDLGSWLSNDITRMRGPSKRREPGSSSSLLSESMHIWTMLS